MASFHSQMEKMKPKGGGKLIPIVSIPRSNWVQPPSHAPASGGHSPSSMMTLMSRTEPARALAKNSFSSSVATSTRNIVVGGEQAEWIGMSLGLLLSPRGLRARLGSGLNMVPPCDWEPETATEHKLPNLASRSGRQMACWLG